MSRYPADVVAGLPDIPEISGPGGSGLFCILDTKKLLISDVLLKKLTTPVNLTYVKLTGFFISLIKTLLRSLGPNPEIFDLAPLF